MAKKKNNDEMRKETIKYQNEDTGVVFKLIYILIGVSIIIYLLYFLTAKFLVKDKFQDEEATKQEIVIDYASLNVGNVFNRPYDEYYVFAYDSNDKKSSYYSSLLSNYKDDKIYYLDLSLDVNKGIVSTKGNKKATNPLELAMVNPTLIKFKNHKIIQYYENISDIEKALR